MKSSLWMACSAMAVMGLAGCGDDDDNIDETNDEVQFDRLYGLGIRLRLPDGTTSATYLRQYTSFEGVTNVTVDTQAREFAGQRRFTKAAGGLLVESTGEPSITRYEFDSRLGFVEGPTLSLSRVGFSSAGLTLVVSDEKAYSISYFDLSIAVFNPVTMELLSTEAINLSSELKDGFDNLQVLAEVSGGRVYISVGFSEFATPSIAENLTVIVLDAATDTWLTTMEDTRCNHAQALMKHDSGDLYVLGDNGYNILRPDVTTCIVRIPSGTTAFDASYLFQPAVALGGQESSELKSLGGSLALTYALDLTALDPTDPFSVILDPVRKPWIIDVAAKTATAVTGVPLTKVNPMYTTSDGVLLAVSSNFDATSIYRLDVPASSASLMFQSEGHLMYLVEFP